MKTLYLKPDGVYINDAKIKNVKHLAFDNEAGLQEGDTLVKLVYSPIDGISNQPILDDDGNTVEKTIKELMHVKRVEKQSENN